MILEIHLIFSIICVEQYLSFNLCSRLHYYTGSFRLHCLHGGERKTLSTAQQEALQGLNVITTRNIEMEDL